MNLLGLLTDHELWITDRCVGDPKTATLGLDPVWMVDFPSAVRTVALIPGFSSPYALAPPQDPQTMCFQGRTAYIWLGGEWLDSQLRV